MSEGEPDDSEVVTEAAAAAERVLFSRLDHTQIADLDVRVEFESGEFEVDVFVEPTEGAAVDDATLQEITDDAALAARGAADDLLR